MTLDTIHSSFRSSTEIGGWPEEILSIGEVRRFERREALQQQGQPSMSVHLLLMGKVLREYEGRDGARIILDIHRRADLIGLTGFFDGGTHPDTATAHTRGAALCIPHAEFQRFLLRYPEANRVFKQQVARRYRHDTAWATSMATDRVETRIRQLLCDLADRFGVWGDVRGLLLDLGLTRAELASLAGTTLETVIRTVNKLRDDGLLTPDGRRFFIPDPDQLRP